MKNDMGEYNYRKSQLPDLGKNLRKGKFRRNFKQNNKNKKVHNNKNNIIE